MDLRLFIEGKVIDTFDDETIILNRSIQDVRDISKLFSDYVQRFSIPASVKNNKILSYFYNLDVLGTFDQHKKAPASLEFKGVELFTGNIELLKAQVKNGNAETYEIVFYGNIKSLDTLAKEDTLQDIDFTAFDEVLSYANVTSSWNTKGDVVWPVFDSGRNWLWSNNLQTNSNNINVPNYGVISGNQYGGIMLEELKPAMKISTMIETIFSHYGYTLNSTWLDSEDLQKQYIHLNRIAGNIREEDTGLNANMRALINTGKALTQNVDTKVNFDQEIYDLANSFTLPDTYTAQYTGTHTFRIDHLVTTLAPANPGDKYTIKFYKNGSPVVFPTITSFNFNNTTPQNSNVNIVLSKNDTLVFYVNCTAENGTLDSFVLTKTGGTVGLFNQTVHMSKQMPNVKVTEFIKGVLETYNLILEPIDEFTFNLQPVDDWYSSGLSKVWDGFIDTTTEDVKKVPVYKNIDFKHKDTTDISSVTFKDITERDFARITYSPNVDFGEDELKIETIFNVLVPTVLLETGSNGQLTQNTTSLHLHKYIDSTGKALGGQLTLMYFNDKQQCAGYYLQNGVDANDNPTFLLSVSYPHFSIFSDYIPDVDTNTLAFSLEESLTSNIKPTNTLFQKYYNNYIGRIYNLETKILTCEAVLPLGEILNLRLNQKIIYNGQQFTINNFKYDFLQEKAFLELLTYDENIPIRSVSAIDPKDDSVTFTSDPTNRDVASYNLQLGTNEGYYMQPYADQVNEKINDIVNLSANLYPLDSEGFVEISGGDFVISVISDEYVIRFLNSGEYTLPELSILLDKSRFVNLKNDSDGNVTLLASGTDTFEGDTSYVLTPKENYKAILTTDEFKQV